MINFIILIGSGEILNKDWTLSREDNQLILREILKSPSLGCQDDDIVSEETVRGVSCSQILTHDDCHGVTRCHNSEILSHITQTSVIQLPITQSTQLVLLQHPS